jgi:hypothetical protein
VTATPFHSQKYRTIQPMTAMPIKVTTSVEVFML